MTSVQRERTTKETSIRMQLDVDGPRAVDIRTGLAFFDHMLEQLAFHAGWNLTIEAEGDLAVDAHHLMEDVGIVLGQCLGEAWRSRGAIQRYGQRILPMDDALLLCAVDLSGRPFADVAVTLPQPFLRDIANELWPHFFASLATAAELTLHIRQLAGTNQHHVVEASFKALAYALREALVPAGDGVASTKGVL